MDYEVLKNEVFIPMMDSIDEVETNLLLDNSKSFNKMYKFAINYVDGFNKIEFEEENAERFLENCRAIDLDLQQIVNAFSEKFELELTIDNYLDFKKVYDLFVGDRCRTIANALLYYVRIKFYDELPEHDKTDSVTDWIRMKKNIQEFESLENILNDFYYERCGSYHEYITFQNLMQDFYSSFSQQDDRESEFMFFLESKDVEDLVILGLTEMKLEKIVGGN